MKSVIVAGPDYRSRPHMTSWFTRAFQRLGWHVVRVGPSWNPSPDPYVDPVYAPPHVVLDGSMVGLSEVVRAVREKTDAAVDLCLMVDQADPWSVHNDGSVPYAYVWREGNPGEEGRVGAASNGAPVFCCMVGKHAAWPEGTGFMPFAADRMFLEGAWVPWEERELDLVYTGRERGAWTYERLEAECAKRGLKAFCSGYLDGYARYAEVLSRAKATYVMDGRYVGSRGLEAMLSGCVAFWEGGPALEQAGGFTFGENCLRIDPDTCPATNERIPKDAFFDELSALVRDRERWTRLSRAGVTLVRNRHTFESRIERICAVLGV